MSFRSEFQAENGKLISLTDNDFVSYYADFCKEIAAEIEANDTATDIHLDFCEFDQENFDLLINAIINRKANFEFVDISNNLTLTKDSLPSIIKLINSGKAQEIRMSVIPAITLDKQCMEGVFKAAKKQGIVIYLDDGSREQLQMPHDTSLCANSIFKFRNIDTVDNQLQKLLVDHQICLELVVKLTPHMQHVISNALMTIPNVYREEKEESAKNGFLVTCLKNPSVSNELFSRIPPHIRLKMLDIILENKLDSEEKIQSSSPRKLS